MTGRLLRMILIPVALAFLAGCGANLRYSQVAPEAGDFKPKKAAIFPVDAGMYPGTDGVVEKIVADVLTSRGWFAEVVSADAVKKRIDTGEEFRKSYTDYMMKLRTVSFSDPDLSKSIGEMIPADAFLLVNVEYWNYAMESGDKLAKVGLGMKLVNASTGKIIWKAAHEEVRKYTFFKPELADVAKSLAKDMISQMPHYRLFKNAHPRLRGDGVCMLPSSFPVSSTGQACCDPPVADLAPQDFGRLASKHF